MVGRSAVWGKALGFGESPAVWGRLLLRGGWCTPPANNAPRGRASLFKGWAMEEEKANQQQ